MGADVYLRQAYRAACVREGEEERFARCLADKGGPGEGRLNAEWHAIYERVCEGTHFHDFFNRFSIFSLVGLDYGAAQRVCDRNSVLPPAVARQWLDQSEAADIVALVGAYPDVFQGSTAVDKPIDTLHFMPALSSITSFPEALDWFEVKRTQIVALLRRGLETGDDILFA